MMELLNRLDGPQLIGFAAVVIGTFGAFSVALYALWSNHRQYESEVALKREMIAANFSPQDIERVILAKRSALECKS